MLEGFSRILLEGGATFELYQQKSEQLSKAWNDMELACGEPYDPAVAQSMLDAIRDRFLHLPEEFQPTLLPPEYVDRPVRVRRRTDHFVP